MNVTLQLPVTKLFCAVDVIAERGASLLVFNNVVVGVEEAPLQAPPAKREPAPLHALAPLEEWKPEPPALPSTALPSHIKRKNKNTHLRVEIQHRVHNFFVKHASKAYTTRNISDALGFTEIDDRQRVGGVIKFLLSNEIIVATTKSRYPSYQLKPQS